MRIGNFIYIIQNGRRIVKTLREKETDTFDLEITIFLGLPKIRFKAYNIGTSRPARSGRFIFERNTIMELIIISDTKLKIMLTAPDMKHYELESAQLDCADAHTRAAFRHIFDDARDRTGFDTEGERLFIQFYASMEGGCEIFVTKLGEPNVSFPPDSSFSANAESPILAISAGEMTEGERELLRRVYQEGMTVAEPDTPSNSPGMPQEESSFMEMKQTEKSYARTGTRTAVVIFSDMEHLLIICRRLLREGYRGRSTVYIDEDHPAKNWYLLLEIPYITTCRLPRKYAFLTEYGQEVEIPGLETYLKEYGHLIRMHDAVDVLGIL